MKNIFDIYCKWHDIPSYLKHAGAAVHTVLFAKYRNAPSNTKCIIKHIEKGIDKDTWNKVLEYYDIADWIAKIENNNVSMKDIQEAAFMFTILNEVLITTKCCEVVNPRW